MNAYYHYKYPNGLQFVSTANQVALKMWLKLGKKEEDYPILLGIWRVKALKEKTNKNK
jgi:hypothetical protein